jgi:hypothetical protein
MGVAVSGPEVRKLGGVALEARAGLFELPGDLLIRLWSRLDVGDAQLPRGGLAAPQQPNDLGDPPIHDTKVVDNHEDRPKAAAVLHAAKPINQHGTRSASGSHWLASRRIVPRSLLKSLVVCSRVLQHRSQAKTSLMIISSSRGSPAPGGASAGTFARLSLSILAKRK